MQICFATNNQNKINEIQAMLPDSIQLQSLSEIGCTEELAENQTTLEGNSHQKAEYVHKKYHVPCFADDTGLEVFCLDGAPGVFSARYAGESRDTVANMALLLKNLKGKEDRKTRQIINKMVKNSFDLVVNYLNGAYQQNQEVSKRCKHKIVLEYLLAAKNQRIL